MDESFDYPCGVVAGVLATLFVRGILFVMAIVVGINIASVVRQGTLAEPGGIVLAIAITAVGWMISLHLLVVCLTSLAAVIPLVMSESSATVAGSLGATCIAWCSVGLWLW